jgi:hypothetical protein
MVKTYTLGLEKRQVIHPEDADRLHTSVVGRQMRQEYVERLEKIYRPSGYVSSITEMN